MKFILLLLIISSSHLGYSQKPVKSDSTIKASKAIIELEDAKAIFKKKKSDSTIRTSKTIIELEDAKTIFKEKKTDFWDKYSSGLIATFTVLVSLGISVEQARNTRRHTKSNIIAEARVEWVQKLRPHLSELITNISKAAIELDLFKDHFFDTKTNSWKTNLPKNQADVFDTEQKKITSIIYDINSNFNQVKLFLNRNEKSHADLISAVDDFMVSFIDKKDIKALTNDLIEKAQIVLKHAWEQAKS